MNKLQDLVQRERDGVLVGREKQLLDEARKRGLIQSPRDSVAEAIREVAKQGQDLHALHAQMVEKVANAIAKAAPKITVPEPVINVEATLNPSAVTVMRGATKWTMTVNRDKFGNITSITAEAE